MPMETEHTVQVSFRVKKPVHKWLQKRKSLLNPERHVSREINLILEEKFMQENGVNAKAQGSR